MTTQANSQPLGRYLFIHRALDEINQGRPDWTGWFTALTPEQKQQYREIEKRVDATCIAGDKPGLEGALADLKTFCLSTDKQSNDNEPETEQNISVTEREEVPFVPEPQDTDAQTGKTKLSFGDRPPLPPEPHEDDIPTGQDRFSHESDNTLPLF